MAVNLARNYTEDQAHHLLNSSFAQFLADRKVVGLERERQRDAEAIDGYRANMRCHLGDFDEYWSLVSRRHIREEDRKDHERARAELVRAAVKLRPGE